MASTAKAKASNPAPAPGKAKSKAAAERKPAARKRKPAARKSSSPKKTAASVQVGEHQFAPGTKVGAYEPQEAEVWAADDREPNGKPVASGTVSDDGTLKFSGLKPGTYAAVGKVAESGGRFGARYAHMTFVAR